MSKTCESMTNKDHKLPLFPSKELIDSMCMRYRHDFNLPSRQAFGLSETDKSNIRSAMKAVYEIIQRDPQLDVNAQESTLVEIMDLLQCGISTAEQLYEEGTGRGFYTHPYPTIKQITL